MEEVFQQLMALLPEIKTALSSNMSKMIAPAQVLGALGALFYIAYRVWRTIASAEPIDVFPLLRPFVIGLIIMNFHWMPSALDTILSPITSATESMAESGQEEVGRKRDQLKRAKQDKLRKEGKGYVFDDEERTNVIKDLEWYEIGEAISIYSESAWYDFQEWIQEILYFVLEFIYNLARLTINTTRILFLSVLTIFGPLIFAFAIFDGFGGGIVSWFSRYINIFLWLPVCDIVTAMLTRINGLVLSQSIETVQSGVDSMGWVDVGLLIFYVIGITLYFSVPTMAGWITEGGVGGAIGGANKLGGLAAAGAGAIAGFAGGAVAGAGGRVVGGIASALKSRYEQGKLTKSSGSKISSGDGNATQG